MSLGLWLFSLNKQCQWAVFSIFSSHTQQFWLLLIHFLIISPTDWLIVICRCGTKKKSFLCEHVTNYLLTGAPCFLLFCHFPCLGSSSVQSRSPPSTSEVLIRFKMTSTRSSATVRLLWKTLSFAVITHFLSSKACESYDFPFAQKGPCLQRVEGQKREIRRRERDICSSCSHIL